MIGLVGTYSGTIRRGSTLLVVVSDFMEVVLVQLAHKAGEVAVLEMFGEYGFGESLVLLRNFSKDGPRDCLGSRP